MNDNLSNAVNKGKVRHTYLQDILLTSQGPGRHFDITRVYFKHESRTCMSFYDLYRKLCRVVHIKSTESL